MARILIVEDEEKIARFVTLELEHEGYQVEHAADGRTATSKCARISAYSLHPGILGDGNIAAAPFIAAADTCAAPPAIGNNLPAGDGDIAAVVFGAAADASAENPAIGGDFSAGDGDITAAP